MTTTQPTALPELPEHAGFIDFGPVARRAYTADQMRARDAMWAERLATLQAQQSTQGDTPAAAGVSDVVAMVRERYRGTKWGKAAECICDAVDEAILALRPQAVVAKAQVPMTGWQPLNAARLNSEEFDGAYWLAMKNGEVAVGEYEWRQGWNPHGFNLIDGGRVGASEITHTATFVRPAHPAHQATKESQ